MKYSRICSSCALVQLVDMAGRRELLTAQRATRSHGRLKVMLPLGVAQPSWRIKYLEL